MIAEKRKIFKKGRHERPLARLSLVPIGGTLPSRCKSTSATAKLEPPARLSPPNSVASSGMVLSGFSDPRFR